ncbi:HIT family protein [Laceyella sacchari]|jgi:diadenosine tetraphosphate (Ap4A) HIT family hydrolase|uniref:HIT family protein n=1 Tax=Laceyella tengchongensis TaxID=574699 RepID=UPI000C9F320D|nr:HIT family protein [Laceyella sacchari]MRG29817.1 HIT domain-containing protein [Laceyella tengchongensis]
MSQYKIECTGCNIIKNLDPAKIIYENHLVICILDIDPVNEGHALIMPKQHYKELTDMPTEVLHSMMDASVVVSNAIKSCFSPHGVMVWQNGGAFNDLDHVHIHVIPRFKDDGFTWKEPDRYYGSKNLDNTREKLRGEIGKILVGV